MMMPCSLSTDDQLVVQRLEQQLKERGHLEELNFEQLVHCMHNNPAYFLHRYGAFLSETERQRLFGKLAEKDWMVRTELWRLRKQRGEPLQSRVVKNRRLAALQELCSRGEYFSDEQMERRDPLLYYRLWGRYASYLSTSDWERIRSADEAHILATPCLEQVDGGGNGATCNVRQDKKEEKKKEAITRPLTNYLMEYFDARDIVEKRMQQRRMEKSCGGSNAKRRASNTLFGHIKNDMETEYIHEQLMEQASDEENERQVANWTLEDFQQSREELLFMMRQRYLNGEDAAFLDYSTVDHNEEYDDVDWVQNDIEEKYFDGQEPESVGIMEQDNYTEEE